MLVPCTDLVKTMVPSLQEASVGRWQVCEDSGKSSVDGSRLEDSSLGAQFLELGSVIFHMS